MSFLRACFRTTWQDWLRSLLRLWSSFAVCSLSHAWEAIIKVSSNLICCHNHLWNRPCLGCCSVSAGVTMTWLISLRAVLIARTQWFRITGPHYLGRRECGRLKGLFLVHLEVIPSTVPARSLPGLRRRAAAPLCCWLWCLSVLAAVGNTGWCHLLQSGSLFFYFFRQTIHMFKSQQLSAQVMNSVPIEKIQAIECLSFNHKCLGSSEAYYIHSWAPNQKTGRGDFYNRIKV